MEQTASTDLIVVGYDGSSAADRALRWAIAEGRRRTSPVRVVHVAEWPVMAMPGEPGWLSEDQILQAKTDLDRAVEAAGGGTHDISIVEGPVVATLCEMSRDASMMVLGARGSGGFHGLLIGHGPNQLLQRHRRCLCAKIGGCGAGQVDSGDITGDGHVTNTGAGRPQVGVVGIERLPSQHLRDRGPYVSGRIGPRGNPVKLVHQAGCPLGGVSV